MFSGDTVLLDGEMVRTENLRVYMALNKPPGFICSSHDPHGRPLALELLQQGLKKTGLPLRLYNIGRLDFMSCGLIFFTNDGDFAALLGHPRCGIEKEYLVEATGHIPDELIDSFENGITVEGERYKAHSIKRIGSRAVVIVLVEGKNREIRRVFSHFHLHPSRLRRVRIGPVQLGSLEEGSSRYLSEYEIEALKTPVTGMSRSRTPRHTSLPPKQRSYTW